MTLRPTSAAAAPSVAAATAATAAAAAAAATATAKVVEKDELDGVGLSFYAQIYVLKVTIAHKFRFCCASASAPAPPL